MKTPLVSVIIPTFNEANHITKCLKSLSRQTYPKIEIIVVDDGSTDSTVNLVKPFKSVKLIKQKHQGPGAARNLGVSKSKGAILVFVDADMTFSPTFISHLTKPIRQGKTTGTFSDQEFVSNPNNYWSKSWTLLRGFLPGRMHPPNQKPTHPVFRAILRSEFAQTQGFDPTRGYDDDWSLSEQLGKLATKAPNAVYYHSNPETLFEFFTQSKWIAKRRYKLGILGKLFSLIKYSLPISFFSAVIFAIKHQDSHLMFSKIIFDQGRWLGIIESVLFSQHYK